MKTFFAKSEDVERKWYLIDARDKIVGKLAVKIANILRGKNKPQFTPHVDTGDFVVVVNAEKIRFTGNKWQDKHYYRYSGYPGGLKSISAKDMLEKHPERILMSAVKGMLPKNRLGRKLIKKLKIYKGCNHPHEAQNPQRLEV
ncbi:MAG: 50S ribosomal protein L13 [Deltaproteobacteria bacterium]|nr:50S ribosomal protein L13 [Deltaproteobacteria bacterium]